jgi:hypothetical protein
VLRHVLCAVCADRVHVQAFEGADMIMHELANNVSIADLMEQPASVRDDRMVPSSSPY